MMIPIKKHCLLAAVAATYYCYSNNSKNKFVVFGRSKNHCNPDYKSIALKVKQLKENKPALFTRMFQLSPEAFDKVLDIIYPKLTPKKFTTKFYVPPTIKLCLGLRLLAGASYLDLSFGYNVPPSSVHHYAWQALNAIDSSKHKYLNNIKSPIHSSADQLRELELGFAKLTELKL
jgi:hypothetical protein